MHSRNQQLGGYRGSAIISHKRILFLEVGPFGCHLRRLRADDVRTLSELLRRDGVRVEAKELCGAVRIEP
jgi:hypothetical protein